VGLWAGGMVIPHVGRMIVGPNHRWLLPTSMALGAVFLLVVDDIARTATPWTFRLGYLPVLLALHFLPISCGEPKGAGSNGAENQAAGRAFSYGDHEIFSGLNLDIAPGKY